MHFPGEVKKGLKKGVFGPKKPWGGLKMAFFGVFGPKKGGPNRKNGLEIGFFKRKLDMQSKKWLGKKGGFLRFFKKR